MTEKITWYRNAQYVALLLAVAALPVGWHYALWASGLLALTSLAAIVATLVAGRRLGVAPLRGAMLGAWLVVLYWLVLLASMLYTTDITTGWEILNLKAVLLIFPLCFVLTDSRWLTPTRLRLLGYVFLGAMVGVFIYHAAVAVGKMLDGSTLASVAGVTFDTRHHASTSLYIAVALAFVYQELYSHWEQIPALLRWSMLAAVPLLILYMVMVNSRAGMLTLYLLEGGCTLHYAFTRRRWWRAVLLAVLLGGFTVGIGNVLPGHQARVASTIEDVVGDEPKDARVKINGSGLKAVGRQPIIGYGVGDYRHCLVEQYGEDDFPAGVSAKFNAHNQYVESLLAAGVFALAALLAMLLWPVWLAVRRRSGHLWLVLMFVGIVAFNLLFESMLERQMGLLFVGLLLAIIALILRDEENKFG